jgi:hypothetical protein
LLKIYLPFVLICLFSEFRVDCFPASFGFFCFFQIFLLQVPVSMNRTIIKIAVEPMALKDFYDLLISQMFNVNCICKVFTKPFFCVADFAVSLFFQTFFTSLERIVCSTSELLSLNPLAFSLSHFLSLSYIEKTSELSQKRGS